MSEAIVGVIGLVASAIAAAIAAYFGTKQRVRAELEARYDAELRNSRLGVYPALWSALEPLAKYAREPPGRPTREEIQKLSASLRKWYFETGGLYLSAEARQAYFDLQDGLSVVVTSERWTTGPDRSEQSTLTYDVGTRRRFSLAPEWQDEDAAANKRAVEEDREAKRKSERVLEQLRSSWSD